MDSHDFDPLKNKKKRNKRKGERENKRYINLG